MTPRRKSISDKTYFKLEAMKLVLSVVALYFLATYFAGQGVEVNVLWSMVILVLGSDFAGLIATYLVHSNGK